MINALTATEAKETILNHTSVLKRVLTVPFENSLGSICAENIVSSINVPNHKNSAMDGYAINLKSARDRQTTASLWNRAPDKIKIIGTATAGSPYLGEPDLLAAVQVMTGAVIPPGYDTVVINEDVSIRRGHIDIKEFPIKGSNVRNAGEDLKRGEICVHQNKKLTAADVGLLASIGTANIKIYDKPKVTIFSTGDEVKNPSENLSFGQIYDSNRYTLAGMLQKMGMEIIDIGIIPDDPLILKKTLKEASLHSDVLITTGGVSVGARDHIRKVLREIGTILFWKIKIKPGRPFTFGNINNCLYFGLPGNPVSAMITFSQFVSPSLSKLSGGIPKNAFLIKAKAVTQIRKIAGRTEYQRGFYQTKKDEIVWVKPENNQGSGVLNSMSRANCIIHLPDEQGTIEKGQFVMIEPFETNPILI